MTINHRAIAAAATALIALGAWTIKPTPAHAPQSPAAGKISATAAYTAAGEGQKPAGETPKATTTPAKSKKPALPAKITREADFASQTEAKAYLAQILGNQGRDYKILEAIIQCESGWEHFRPTGEVKIATGNVGFGQINRPTWEKWMADNYGLDIYKQKENLQATVIIYRRSGTGPWRPYSGHCWLPKLEAAGIEI